MRKEFLFFLGRGSRYLPTLSHPPGLGFRFGSLPPGGLPAPTITFSAASNLFLARCFGAHQDRLRGKAR